MAIATYPTIFILLYTQCITAQQPLNNNINIGLNGAQQQAIQRATSNPQNVGLNFNPTQQTNQQQTFNMQQPSLQASNQQQVGLQQVNLQQNPITVSNFQLTRQPNQPPATENTISSLANTRLSQLSPQISQVNAVPNQQVLHSVHPCDLKSNFDQTPAILPKTQSPTYIPVTPTTKQCGCPPLQTLSVETQSQPKISFQPLSNLTPQNIISQTNQVAQSSIIPIPNQQTPGYPNQVASMQPQGIQNQQAALNSLQNLQGFTLHIQSPKSHQNLPLVSIQSQPVTPVINPPTLNYVQSPPSTAFTPNQVGVNPNQNIPNFSSVQSQPTLVLVQNQPVVPNLTSNQTPLTFNSVPAQSNLVQNQPTFIPVQNQGIMSVPSPTTPNLPSVQLQSSFGCQNQPTFSAQNQVPWASVQNQPGVVYNTIQNQPSLSTIEKSLSSFSSLPTTSKDNQSELMSFIASQRTPPTNTYPVVYSTNSNQGSKSNFKAILPLILNLMKERSGCGCSQCGCRNQNNNNKNQEPQIFRGYSNQKNYGQPKILNDDSFSNLFNSDSVESFGYEDRNNFRRNVIKEDSQEDSEEDDFEYGNDSEESED